ncbi:hypothetical protein AcW1_002468 [Taiwanofungus camphoratus]|nr:hypothetical protein AcW1_002468 [Antrodia cinnamomea]
MTCLAPHRPRRICSPPTLTLQPAPLQEEQAVAPTPTYACAGSPARWGIQPACLPPPLSGVSASSLAPPGACPHAGSFASTSTSPPDSPQRISVAAFQEMAAWRSAVNSPSPSLADLAIPLRPARVHVPACTSPAHPHAPT